MARAIDYFSAAYPDTWQVLGVTLRPFSLGHYFKLRRLGNAFVADGDADAGLGDLILGVICCSMRTNPDPEQDEFWCWLNNVKPTIPLRFRNLVWTPKLTPAEWDVYRWGRRNGASVSYKEKAKQFADYVRIHSEPPAFIPREEDRSAPSGSHWSHNILHLLQARCNYTEERALNAPLGRAIADFYKYLESEGGGRLTTAEEEELFA